MELKDLITEVWNRHLSATDKERRQQYYVAYEALCEVRYLEEGVETWQGQEGLPK